MNEEKEFFYAYCIQNKCRFFTWASSLDDAKKKLELHEAKEHKGKQIGTYGVSINNPTNFLNNSFKNLVGEQK